jgi:hypothetical protein
MHPRYVRELAGQKHGVTPNAIALVIAEFVAGCR